MERIPVHSLGLFTFLVLILGVTRIHCATVSSVDQTARLGNNQFAVTCSYTLQPNEDFLNLVIARLNASGYQDLAFYQNGKGLYSTVSNSFKERTNLTFQEGVAAITYDSVMCGDKGRYRCLLSYSDGSQRLPKEGFMTVTVEALPGKPTFIPSDFDTKTYKENDIVTVQCQGRVGNPGGNYVWYAYNGNGPGVDISSRADPGTLYGEADTECFYQRLSTLKYNLTRSDNNMTIRCATNQSLLSGPPTASDLCSASFCLQSNYLKVEYPVRQNDLVISRLPSYSEYIIGSEVTLSCAVSGNPAPEYAWTKDGEENATVTDKEWQLKNLQLEDNGIYTCYVSNTVGNVVYNATKSVNIRVVATTTTTSTTTQSTKSPEESTSGVKPPPQSVTSNSADLRIIIPCVIVGVLIIVAIIVAFIVIRRRRAQKEVEEPPEKPYNNHNMSIYNTKPDLVTNDEKKQNYYNKEDRLTYADLKFDDKPRSRRPVALADSVTDYADISMPQV